MESVSGRAQKWSQAMCLDPWDSFCFTKPSRRTVALNMKRDTMQPVTLTLQSLTAQEGFHNVTRYTKTEDNWFFPKHVNIQASKKQTGCAPVHSGILSPASYTWWWALTHISQAARHTDTYLNPNRQTKHLPGFRLRFKIFLWASLLGSGGMGVAVRQAWVTS